VSPVQEGGSAVPTLPGAVDPHIPHFFHTIWYGPKPDWFEEYVGSWHREHPHWKFCRWNEAGPPTSNRDIWDRAEEIAGDRAYQLQADVMRLDLLYEFGGVYIDADLYCQKPIDRLLPGVDCFAAWEDPGIWVNNAVMGATPKHPFIKQLVDNLAESVENGNGRPNIISGPQFITKQLAKYDPGITILPKDYFYPYLWDELDRDSEEFPEAYAVHRWNNARRRRLT
jgi:mannosyltransferase OCH1-like enzyme